MTDQLLGILKLALLALLYLFFARVLWAVWTEVRGSGHPIVPQGTGPAQPASTKGAKGSKAPRSPKRQGRRGKASSGQVARLVVVEPAARKGATLGVDREITFGRAQGCTVSVPDDAYMSQVHARVYMSEGDVFVEDLSSTNGTFINGDRVHGTQQLFHGDRLQVGHTVLEAD